jgi:hypothetical protein
LDLLGSIVRFLWTDDGVLLTVQAPTSTRTQTVSSGS